MTGGSVIRNGIPIIPPRPLGRRNETISSQGSMPAQILHNPPWGVKNPTAEPNIPPVGPQSDKPFGNPGISKKNYLYII